MRCYGVYLRVRDSGCRGYAALYSMVGEKVYVREGR